jgi:hypothetical protein
MRFHPKRERLKPLSGPVAYRAEYGNSGIMTFMVNHAGTVYQKDLGERTSAVAKQMTAFDNHPRVYAPVRLPRAPCIRLLCDGWKPLTGCWRPIAFHLRPSAHEARIMLCRDSL